MCRALQIDINAHRLLDDDYKEPTDLLGPPDADEEPRRAQPQHDPQPQPFAPTLSGKHTAGKKATQLFAGLHLSPLGGDLRPVPRP